MSAPVRSPESTFGFFDLLLTLGMAWMVFVAPALGILSVIWHLLMFLDGSAQ